MHKALVSIVLVCLFTSCASSRRMTRFFSEKSQSAEKEAGRTNVFPLYYESGDSSSILWPLIDNDEHGFSFRPFFNKEDDEYAVLFPFAAWNSVAGDGWIGPYMWDKESQFLFPFFYKDEDDFQFLTYYNLNGTKGLFPLYHMDDDGGWAGGLYGWEKTKDSSIHKGLFGMLAYWENKNNGDNTHYLFPYYSTKDGGSTSSTFLPLYFSGEEDNGSSYSTLFPLFFQNSNAKGEERFHSLLGGYSKNGDDVDLNVTPLWWSGSDDKGSYQTLFPLYYNSEYGDEENLYLFPYFSTKDSHGGGSLLFPLFIESEDKNSSFLLTPLSFSYEEKKASGLHIVPLFNSSKKLDDKGEIKESSWQFPWLIPLVSNKQKKDSFETSSLFGAIYHNKGNKTEGSGSVLGFLAGWEKTETTSRFRFPAIFNMTGLIDLSEDEKSSKVNMFFYSSETTETTTRRDIFPFITWDNGENESGFSFLWRVFETHDRNGKKGGHFMFIPWGEDA
jgi:hypothetical protein